MSGKKITEDTIARIRTEMAVPGATITGVAAKLDLNRDTIRKYFTAPPSTNIQEERPQETRSIVENADGTAVLSAIVTEPIKTIEDAIRVAEIDTSIWYVDRSEVSDWTVPIKLRGPDGDQLIQQQQYRVRIHLRRIMQRSLQMATQAIFDRMKQHAPKYPAIPRVKGSSGEQFLAVLGLFDVHFGKLCWASETGDNYDLRIAEAIFANAVDDLVSESASRPVARWLMPIGNDFYHIDNSRNTTYAGTPQDTDGRYAKIIEAGEMSVIGAIEKLIAIAPVDVIWVPGNHDPTTSLHLARTVAAWFRKCSRVAVDHSPSPRKYVHWNATLLGLTHGNEERKEDLPSLMATERPTEWAASRCREWLCGHDHRERKWMTKPVDSHQGTTTRVLRSLAGTDSWHHRKGYIHTSQAAEVYWYGERRGYAGHAVVLSRSESG